jgi:hypothetical protein
MGNSTSSMLNMIQGHNITNIKNFGAVFKDVLDVDFLKEKDVALKKLTNSGLILPKVDTTINAKLSNQEYMFLTKNFINLYNENNKKRMKYLKKSFGIKYVINDTHFLYIILFFSEFEDFNRSSKSQNILFVSISEKEKDFTFEDSLLYSKIIGQWGSSDVLMGSENEFVKSRFINIFKDSPIKYVLDKHIIQDVLDNKGYITNNYYERGMPERQFETQKPEYIKTTNPIKIKLGDKCLNVSNNKLSFVGCNDTESKFKFTEKSKLEYTTDNNNNCVAYHQNGDMTLVPCDTINVCSNSSNIQSCQIFKSRKFGGLEIVGKERKCLMNNKTSQDCHKSDKVSYL